MPKYTFYLLTYLLISLSRVQAAAAIAQKIVKSVTKVADMLASSLKVGAPPVKIELPKMSMEVRKSNVDTLLKEKIESDIGSCKIDSLPDVDDSSCVSTQVTPGLLILQYYNYCNKAIVDSRLRPQSCCHLANFIEMQEIVDCKLDANNE